MSEVQRLKKKIKRYEEILKEIEDDEENELLQSSIFERNKNGTIQKVVRSNLGSGFLVLDQGRDLDELNKSTYNAIAKQDSYSQYKRVEQNVKEAGGVYAWTTYMFGIANLVWLL
jgi:hypothetical protein